ncbi:hypothetical protein MMAD_47840 [Mycolicibacterium madagascariense]|uniref:Uncharacterized protein n=1 Tax=Mycolicibacterium madagascariense TaxID=212765 RepID=A0A7I7XML7_9MYCO|nr:hypothetical protein MMAD_47840 [Mycolicibacterium madagascariense]
MEVKGIVGNVGAALCEVLAVVPPPGGAHPPRAIASSALTAANRYRGNGDRSDDLVKGR